MTFFLDACISPQLARALKALENCDAGCIVVVHNDVFESGVEDTKWIPKLRGMNVDVLVTSDSRIIRSPDETKAWVEAGVTSYFLSNKFSESARWPQVKELIRWWPDIRRHAKAVGRGSAWRLEWGGTLPKEAKVKTNHPKQRPKRDDFH